MTKHTAEIMQNKSNWIFFWNRDLIWDTKNCDFDSLRIQMAFVVPLLIAPHWNKREGQSHLYLQVDSEQVENICPVKSASHARSAL